MSGLRLQHILRSYVALLSTGLSWWLHEMRQAIPSFWRSKWHQEQDALFVTWQQGKVSLSKRVTGHVTPIQAAQGLPPDEISAALLGDICDRHFASKAALCVVLQLKNGQYLKRSIQLPLMPDSLVRKFAGHELPRLTPFAPSEVFFDCLISSRDYQKGEFSADIYLCDRKLVDEVDAVFSNIGVDIDCVKISGVSERLVDLRKGGHPSRRKRQILNSSAAVWASAASVLLASWIIVLQALDARIENAAARIDTLRSEAEHVRNIEEKAKDIEARLSHISSRNSEISAASVLQELSRLLPDETWIYGLVIKQDSIDVEGYSKNSPALLPVLDSSNLFHDSHFISPVMEEAGDMGQRFKLSSQIARVGGRSR